jgi:urease accessory protein
MNPDPTRNWQEKPLMKKDRTGRQLLLLLVFTAFTPATLAHTHGAHGAGFVAGGLHPFLGLDHLLAMVAVGLWAAQLGGRALWMMPAAFVTSLVAGALLAYAGVALPAVETTVILSLLILGSLVVSAARLPIAAGMTLVGGFALFHGHAHGSELPQAANAWFYLLGFSLATALLHAAGVIAGTRLRGSLAWLVRGAGMAVVGSGVWLLAG